ncbi:hypothetical protein TNCV_111 [Trichonephila clavipes]|nr:hypothetical protein TNCV_111 [Trichonephila clavipes]
MFDGNGCFAMDRWRHDCGAPGADYITARVTNVGEDSIWWPSVRNVQMKASTLTITPKRSSSRDVGTNSYRYHTATVSKFSVQGLASKQQHRQN